MARKYVRTAPLVPVLQRMAEKIERRGPDECWPWRPSVGRGEYGAIRFRGRAGARATRVLWGLVYGPIPPGLMVCHTCDYRPCMNLRHLFLGTAKDNAQDRARKGRAGAFRRQGAS